MACPRRFPWTGRILLEYESFPQHRHLDALDWLNIVQRGGTEEWKRLYQLCRNLEIARQVVGMMPLRDPDLLASARLWKFLLEDLHPGLRVELDETHRNIGV